MVRLTVRAMTGEEAHYGPVAVKGNVSVGDDVIRRTLAFEPGDRFSLASVQLSQRRLYELGLFQVASVALGSEGVSKGEVPVEVHGGGGQAPPDPARRGLRFRGARARRGAVETRQLPRGCPQHFDRKQVVVARSRLRSTFIQPYLFQPSCS
jgi:hypothetical protein